MGEWTENNFSPTDGHYLCFVKGMVCCWQEVLVMRDGSWFDLYGDPLGLHNGKMSCQAVECWMPLPAPPKK